MPDNSVTTTFFADEKAAAEAIVRLEKKYDDLENKIKHVHRASREGGESKLGEGISEAITEAAGLVFGITSVAGAAEKVVDSIREWHTEILAAAKEAAKFQSNLNIRSGKFGAEGEETKESILRAAKVAGTDKDTAAELYHSLVENGAEDQEAQKALPRLLATFQATNAARGGGLSAADFAGAVSASLGPSSGKNAGELGDAGKNLFGLMRGTKVGTGDVGALSETLQNLSAGKGAARHAAALSQLGLKFEDVDLQGEDLVQAMTKIKSGLEKVDPRRQSALLQELTGDAGMAKRFNKALGKMGDNAGMYDRAVLEATSGPLAGEARAKLALEEAAAAEGKDQIGDRDAAKAILRERGESGSDIWAHDYLATWQAPFIGEKAAAVSMVKGSGGKFLQESSEEVAAEIDLKKRELAESASIQLMRQQNELLREMNRKLDGADRNGKEMNRKLEARPRRNHEAD